VCYLSGFEAQHRAIRKKARKTNPIERLNGTLRQRLSRWVRSALSFSKTQENHLGAIRYFLSDYTLDLARS
jgi:IS1 family transposase